MICTICKQDVPLNKAGCFSMHRISDEHRHRWSFCDMSGKPAELALTAQSGDPLTEGEIQFELAMAGDQ